MKISFFSISILEGGGGLAKYFIDTSVNLKKLLPGVEISIITLDEELIKKIRIFLSIYYLKDFTKVKLIKEKTEDIANALGEVKYVKCSSFKNLLNNLKKQNVIYSKNEILEAFIFKCLMGYENLPPIIFGCHTPIYYPITKSIHSKLHNFFYNSFVYKFLASGVRKFHVINTFDGKQLKKLFPKKEIIKIYNPFDFDEFVQNSEKYKYEFNWNKTKFNILWTGRLVEQKGISDLIKIIDEINKTGHKNKIIWNIVGDGLENKRILDLKEGWDNVNYFGYIENKYIASICKENDLFISTSKWEGFPYNLLEAQSFGLPVVTFNISGCNDIVENKNNGFVVNDLEQFKDRVLFFVNGNSLNTNIAKFIEDKFSKNSIDQKLIGMFKEYDKKN